MLNGGGGVAIWVAVVVFGWWPAAAQEKEIDGDGIFKLG